MSKTASAGNVTFKFDKCPSCINGRIFEPRDGDFRSCDLCYGKGVLVIDHICACGKPCSTLSADGFLYCGRKECLKDLQDDKRDAELGIDRVFAPSYRRGWSSLTDKAGWYGDWAGE